MTRSRLASTTAGLVAVAVLAGSQASRTSDATPAASADFDWCALFTADLANLALGGGAAKPLSEGTAKHGSCTWERKLGEGLMLEINRSHVDRATFEEACKSYSAPSMTAPFGVAACAKEGRTIVLVDAHTLLVAIGSGTTAQHVAIVKAVAGRLPR